jgi:hypothetical protein
MSTMIYRRQAPARFSFTNGHGHGGPPLGQRTNPDAPPNKSVTDTSANGQPAVQAKSVSNPCDADQSPYQAADPRYLDCVVWRRAHGKGPQKPASPPDPVAALTQALTGAVQNIEVKLLAVGAIGLGAVLILAALYILSQQTQVGRAAASAAKTTIKTGAKAAVTAAVLVPK